MNSPKNARWELIPPVPDEADLAGEIAAETGLSLTTATVLCRRGYRNAEEVRSFLSCTDALLYSPFLMKDMEKAAGRLHEAIERNEPIVIYGDYDVDGVTSVSLLYLYLKEKGAEVFYYIPSRTGEGYGLSGAAVRRLYEAGARLMVTVDTGITANEECALCAELGLDVVVTDHHECRLPLPDAVAVVNPHRPDCDYPFKDLAGVGVTFKLVCACESLFYRDSGESEMDAVRRICMRFADLTAIGTVADVMPLCSENRLIVKLGLLRMAKTERPGLAALIREASAGNRPAGDTRPVRPKKMTASFIGFGLAPRLNAAGRMREATLAVNLLLCEDPGEAEKLAAEICEINRERQSEENRIAADAQEMISRDPGFSVDRVLVLSDDHWRQGIIGIVASRLTENYGKPAILISFDGATRGFDSPDDLGKGSGRSVKGLNLVRALSACEDLLYKFGGHELAAGLTVRRDRVDEFRERINKYAEKELPEGFPGVTLTADAELSFANLSLSFCEELSLLEPFGVSNPAPKFLFSDLYLERITDLSAGKHLKLTLRSGALTFPALYFSMPRLRFPYRVGDRIDLLAGVDINEFRGERTVQLVVEDVRASERYRKDLCAARERFLAVRAGAPFDFSEGFLPDRNDFAQVYTIIRQEYRIGNDTFPEETLLSLINENSAREITYGKLCYILEIFDELKICGVKKEGRIYHFTVYFAGKTNIEKSSILHKLRSQCRNRGGEEAP